ncbi:dihydrofolate reductase isoform X2 [Spea bombifrons]|uniref:dihydrofolate reductase isoform X2 n=1 Tax=Spea bombifrons TaxID=233779 RepID=UPI00234BD375|nr:dihydrofolate reductase isoform X2 [Spea bombifrons]
MRSLLLNSIVAVCPPGQGIGKAGSLPWPPLRNEFKHFQRLTMTPTHEEKNRPLKERINIVLSKELTEPPKGAHYLSKSLDEALSLLETSELKDCVDLIWIIGGSSLYKEVMDKPVQQRLFLTRILQEFECDTFLPEIDLNSYKLLPEFPGIPSEIQEENGIQYKFEVYEKSL